MIGQPLERRHREGVTLLKKVFAWLRPRARPQPAPAPAAKLHIQLINPWHAVSIAVNKRCCRASMALKGRRFLSGEAPRLPLDKCDLGTKCSCVYKHFNDRRAGFRRATEQDYSEHPMIRAAPYLRLQERRRSKGRRATDGH